MSVPTFKITRELPKSQMTCLPGFHTETEETVYVLPWDDKEKDIIVPKVRIGSYWSHFKRPPHSTCYTYEFLGIGYDQERGEIAAVYRALYKEAQSYQAGQVCVRPYTMFTDMVTRDNVTTRRFIQVTNPKLIAELEKKKAELYENQLH